MSKRLLSAVEWQIGLLTVGFLFSFYLLMESDGMGPGHLFLWPCRKQGDLCPKIAQLSAHFSCQGWRESVKEISACWSVRPRGKTQRRRHLALMGLSNRPCHG